MRKIAVTTLVALFLSSAGFAQMPGPPPGPPHGEFGRGGPLGPGGPGGPGMHPWKVVTGAPYSAVMNEQSVETLPNNGGTITRSVTGNVYRDSSGRTYVQQTFTGGPFESQNGQKTVIFITDPVEGVSYTLYPDKNLAIKRPFKAPSSNAAGNPPKHTPPNNPNVNVNKTTGGTYQNLTDIDTTTMTHNIPANTIGNSQALTSTSTVLYSTTLQIVVSSTRNDPRFGTSTYSLSNVVLGEPSVSFSVPAGYTVQTESGHGHGWSHQ